MNQAKTGSKKNALASLCALVSLAFLVACETEVEPQANGPTDHIPMGMMDSDGGGFEVLSAGDINQLVESFRKLAPPGVRVHFLRFSGESELLLLIVNIAQFEPAITGQGENSKNGISARKLMKNSDFVAIVGSSFVSEVHTFEPVGLLQIQDKVVSPVQPHGYTRILGVGPEGLGVVNHRAYERGLFISAFQAGPGIVESGKLDISVRDLERPRYFRAFAATCQEKMIMGVSLVPMNLYTLGQDLVKFFKNDSLPCDEVVNLAGDRQALLAIISSDRTNMAFVGDPRSRKAAILGVRGR